MEFKGSCRIKIDGNKVVVLVDYDRFWADHLPTSPEINCIFSSPGVLRAEQRYLTLEEITSSLDYDPEDALNIIKEIYKAGGHHWVRDTRAQYSLIGGGPSN